MSDISLRVDDAAKRLKVADSTVRKYAVLLEKKGYHFERNNQGAFLFTVEEVDLFRDLQQAKKTYKDVSMDELAETLVQAVLKDMPEKARKSDISSKYQPDMSEILQKLEMLQTEMTALREENAILLQAVEESKGTKELMLEFRQLMIEQQKEPVVEEMPNPVESEEAVPEPPKKRFFQFWK